MATLSNKKRVFCCSACRTKRMSVRQTRANLMIMIYRCLIVLLIFSAGSLPAIISANELLTKIENTLMTGDAKTALELSNQELRTNPENPGLLFLKSRAQIALGDIDEARKILDDLVARDPSPETLNNLAWINAESGKYKAAKEKLLRGLETDPRYTTIYNNLNSIYAALASQAYQKALGKKKAESPKPDLQLLSQLQRRSEQVQVNAEPPPERKPVILSIREKQLIEKAIKNTVLAWAKAWSDKAVDKYLEMYHADFVPPNDLDRETWKSIRRDRLMTPKFIKVAITNTEITLLENGKFANASFFQSYQSNTFDEKVKKILLLKQINGKWQILLEQTGV